jgi:hypothetical protein
MRLRTDAERIAVLESEMRDMKDDVHETRKKVSEMHDLLMQAKGARWAVGALLILIGTAMGFIADKLHKLLPFVGGGPR